MSNYDPKNVDNFIDRILSRRSHTFFEFIAAVHEPWTINSSTVASLLDEFDSLSNWERANILYKLAPDSDQLIKDLAKHYVGEARAEDAKDLK